MARGQQPSTAKQRRGFRADTDGDGGNTVGPQDMLSEEEQEAVIDKFKTDNDRSNLVFKVLFIFLSWSFAAVYWTFLLDPSTPTDSEQPLFVTEHTSPTAFSVSLALSALVTTTSPAFLFVPGFNPYSLRMPPPVAHVVYYVFAVLSVMPLVLMIPADRLDESGADDLSGFKALVGGMDNAELTLWTLPVLNAGLMGYVGWEMNRVGAQIGALEGSKYKLKGA
ncbi:hypothetical protein BC831DRAFT_458493 [Entophlyctis helioformis]|nr:hypothetical protein BC831DRAFT_458493 [Entophlyctis helioformis]